MVHQCGLLYIKKKGLHDKYFSGITTTPENYLNQLYNVLVKGLINKERVCSEWQQRKLERN